MYEKFTEKATKVVMLAQEEARRLGHNFVGAEMLLLGLIGEGNGVAAKTLKSMNVNLKDVRVEVEKIIGRGSGYVSVEIPFTPRAKRVLNLACDESLQWSQTSVDTEHVLLGIIRDGEGAAIKVLEGSGVDLKKLENALHKSISDTKILYVETNEASVEQEIQEIIEDCKEEIGQILDEVQIRIFEVLNAKRPKTISKEVAKALLEELNKILF